MIYLLETETQYNYLLNSGFSECYCEVIGCFSGNTHHPIVNPISCVYIKPIVENNKYTQKGYILPIKHIDTPFFLPKRYITKLLKKFTRVWVRDKKSILHSFSLNNITQIPHMDIQNTQPIQQNFEYRLKNQPINYMRSVS